MYHANAQLSVTLSTSNYNGSNISCFGMQDGSITANPTGGTPPYTYLWSNQETGQTISSLAAGYYRVEVKDDLGAIVYGEVTLTEPEALQVTPAVNTYSNGYNISCYNCFNGSIALTISGGIAPYTHLWSDGSTQKNRWSLGPGNISVVITDANGCEVNSETMYLNQPERSDWTMTGNSGSNASTNFIGTTDSVAVSFRSNNTERLKINANGKIKIPDLATTSGSTVIGVDSLGILKQIGPIVTPNCYSSATVMPWNQIAGTYNLFWCYEVAIGGPYIAPGYMLSVDGKIISTEVKVKNRSQWPDYVFKEEYQKINLDELEAYIQQHHHLPDVITAEEEEKEGHELGAMDAVLLKKIEELTLYVIELNKRNNALECELNKVKQQLVTTDSNRDKN